MNPYLFTLTFLLMMSFLTSSEVIRSQQNLFEHKQYVKSQQMKVDAEELRELSHIETLRSSQSEAEPNPEPDLEEEIAVPRKAKSKWKKALGVNEARPPNNARLNLYSLLHKEHKKKLPKEFSLYEVTAHVIRELYKADTFYYRDVEYHILDRLIALKDKTVSFSTPDELSKVDLEDETLQKIFHQMLKGTKTAPSLLHYITYDNVSDNLSKINFMFADPIILHAIFPKGDTADLLIAKREAILDAIEYQESHRKEIASERYKNRTLFKEDTLEALTSVLSTTGYDIKEYKRVFDITLGHPGTVLFIENPITKTVTRELYVPR